MMLWCGMSLPNMDWHVKLFVRFLGPNLKPRLRVVACVNNLPGCVKNHVNIYLHDVLTWVVCWMRIICRKYNYP